MRKLEIRRSFDNDMKLVKKQGWDLNKVKMVIAELQTLDEVPANRRPHSLSGNYISYMECHIYSDLVVVYRRDEQKVELIRIGRHQDLFKNY